MHGGSVVSRFRINEFQIQIIDELNTPAFVHTMSAPTRFVLAPSSRAKYLEAKKCGGPGGN